LLDFDFGNKNNIGFGIEAEYIFPFNKNKWAIAIEPTYQSFKADTVKPATFVSGGKLISTINYTSVEIPISIRHYFFLSKLSKIFVTGAFIFDKGFKSSVEFKRLDNSIFDAIDIKNATNFSIGAGYKLKDKYSMELRYQTNRNIMSKNANWQSNYQTVSLNLGYTIF
jgi:hypothetical protein